MNESAVELKLSMSDDEAEEVLGRLGIIFSDEFIDRFSEIAGENILNPWPEQRTFEKQGMKITERITEIEYEISGEGWSCKFTGFDNENWFDEVTGHAAMLMYFVKHGILDPDLAVKKLHQLRNNA